MKERTVLASALLTVLLLSLGLVGLSQAQEPDGLEGEGLPPDAPSVALGTGFTYQGRLTDGGGPANGAYDFRFQLYNAASGGSQVGSTLLRLDFPVSDGLFSVNLDFGDVFNGAALWLQVGVRPGASSGAFTELSPRQEITAAPYAISLRPGASILGNIGGDSTLYASNNSAVDYSSGVYGKASSTAYSITYGVYGESASIYGRGVYGHASSTEGYTYGVYGQSDSTSGMGLLGHAIAGSGLTYGVWGQSNSTAGTGLFGLAIATSGENYGVYGWSKSSDGTGVYGKASSTASSVTYGVYGESASKYGKGVYGQASATSGGTYGVYGQSDSTDGTGVYGYATATSGWNYGVKGHSASTDGIGVRGVASATSGTTFGVYGASDSPNGYGGYFVGDVYVSGDLSASGSKAFKIDHPLDPTNQYLYHYSVESPEVLDQYSGNATLDENGEAWVELPDWFPAINTDFRYQLTPIGAPAPNLHIAQEIEGNRFKIAGGEPGMKISWTVTALRNDPYMRQYPQPVEQRKPYDELGTYLYPELYGQPQEAGLDFKRNPDLNAPEPPGSE